MSKQVSRISRSRMMPFLLIFVVLFPVLNALPNNCPPSEDIAPLCTCRDLGDGPMMLCHNIMRPDDLITPIQQAENRSMFSLVIEDSSLLYLPKRIFKNTNFKKVLLDRTQLMSLAEEDLPFEGLEETLEEFRVADAHYATQWSWSHLRNHHKLDTIDIDWVSLGSISEPFPPLKSLKALGISRGGISFIVKNAFQGLENIRLIVLNRNEITNLRRSMFPNPATMLNILDLSENKLSSLPKDMFSSMPNLKDLNLERNKFVTLTEEPFQKVFETIYTLSLKNNNLRCDCRLKWVVNSRMPPQFEGECAHPKHVRGSSLGSLRMYDFWC